MKPKLKGDLQNLYGARVTLQRNLKSGRFVEYIGYTGGHSFNGKEIPRSYYIGICGMTSKGVPCAAYYHPETDKMYFWQYVNRETITDILEHPENVYRYADIKNSIVRTDSINQNNY